MNSSKELINRAKKVLIPAYNRYPIVLDYGKGNCLYDVEGKKYLDFSSGIGVFAFGYQKEALNKSMKDQIDKITHTSNLYYTKPLVTAAEKFVEASQMDQVFFTNSGAEAIEGAIKLARKYYFKKHNKADSTIIAMEHSFHGRTLGALSVTGTKHYREAFEPLIGGAVFAQYNDYEDIISKVTDKTCAVLLETVQGEGGIYPADKEVLQKLRAFCTKNDILLILDEIQCGMGRTGTMFAYEQYDVLPDIMTSAKALGCGIPVGAFAAVKKVSEAFEPGDHGSTYGGNPFAMAAVNAVFSIFEEENILEHVNETGTYLQDQLLTLLKKKKSVLCVRGKKLMQGMELTMPVKDIILSCQEKGVLLLSAGANVLRFLPPLTITKEEIDFMISVLDEVIQ